MGFGKVLSIHHENIKNPTVGNYETTDKLRQTFLLSLLNNDSVMILSTNT